MLRLGLDKGEGSKEDLHYKSPEYISLSSINTVIGRGFKAGVRLAFAWLSRIHLTITKVDGHHILNSDGQNAVFVNHKRVEFTRLEEGDTITIGGGKRSSPIGSAFPKTPGPYVTYTYCKSAKELRDKENCYKNDTKPQDLIQLQDVVNGHMVTQNYHLEDFNATDELTAEDNAANATLVMDSLRSTRSDVSSPTSHPKTSDAIPQQCTNNTSIDTGSSQCTPVITSAGPASSSTSTQPASTISSNTSGKSKPVVITSPLIAGRKNRKSRAAASACKDMLATKVRKPPAKGRKPVNSESKNSEGASPGADDVLPAGTPSPANPTETETVPEQPAPQNTELASAKVVENSAGVPVDECCKPPDTLKDVIDQVASGISIVENCSVISDVVEVQSIASRSSSVVMMDYDPDMACVIKDQSSTDDIKVANPDVQSNSNKLSIKPTMRKRKRISYMECDSQSVGGDSDFQLDENEGTGEEDFQVKPVRSLKDVLHPTKKARVDQPSPVSKGKGKATGKGKAKNKPAPSQEDLADKAMIKNWFNQVAPRPKPRVVEVLNGKFRKTLYTFIDKQVFTVIYKNGEDLTDKNLWDTDEYDVIVSVDSALFEHKLKLGQIQSEDLTRVLGLIRKSSTTLTMKDYDQPTPATKVKRVEQPSTVTVQLKQYQLDTLGWMYLVEGQVDRTWKVAKLAEWVEAESEIMYDVHNRRVYFPPVPAIPSTEYRISIKGGILADEMGLGKTVTLLSLIVTHQAIDTPRIPPPEIFRNHEELQLPCRATLVIAPSHLTAQWKHEAETHCPGLKIIIITTKPQFERVSYADVLLADLVVVSVQFLLTNKVYTSLPTGADAETSFMELLQKPGINPLQQKSPNFGHFNWWRLVCDEAHELITYESKHNGKKGYEYQCSQGLQTLEKLKAKHKWYMTGTPFPHAERSLRGALKFLEMKIDDQNLTYADGSLKVDQELSSYALDYLTEGLYLSPIHRFILDTVYVRNTKQSIGREYNVPEYMEELMLLTQSEVEKGIYDRASTELEQRQLCSHLQIAARVQMIAGVQQKSLEEVKVAMIDHARREIERTHRSIEQTKEDIKQARKDLVEEDRANYRTMIENRIKRYKESIKASEAQVVKHNSSLAYFENIVPRITQSADEPCVICMDNLERLTLTPCGHLYCRKCIVPYVQQQRQCPTCRKTVSEQELVEVQDPNQRENLQKSAELHKLTEQFGTKMAYLIFFLRHLFQTDPESRVIIFSQWDDMLHKIGSTLNDNGIRNVFVKGNVHVRNKAIMSFRKQEKTRVIMLSLENAASGTNLVEASHVILIDPVAGSKAQAVAVESQAIGRAHRMGQDKEIRVVRMIMKDTIEHQLYSRNNADSIQQVELNFDEEEVNIHGPQVIRKVRKVPKPTNVAAAEPSVFTSNNGASTSGTSRATGGSRSRRVMTTHKEKARSRAPRGSRRRNLGGWGGFRRRNFGWWWDDMDGHNMDGHNSDEECDCDSCFMSHYDDY